MRETMGMGMMSGMVLMIDFREVKSTVDTKYCISLPTLVYKYTHRLIVTAWVSRNSIPNSKRHSMFPSGRLRNRIGPLNERRSRDEARTSDGSRRAAHKTAAQQLMVRRRHVDVKRPPCSKHR